MLHSLCSQVRGKHSYNPLQSRTQKALLPTLPFPWTTLYLLCSTVSCSSFSPHRREDKEDGASKPRLIQQKKCNTDPSPPALYPHSRRSAESRGVLRRMRPPACSQRPSQQWRSHWLLTPRVSLGAKHRLHSVQPQNKAASQSGHAAVIQMTSPQETTRAEAGHYSLHLPLKLTLYLKTHHETESC